MFPALVNCCTIDWFMPWPEDALKSVAERALDDASASPGAALGLGDVLRASLVDTIGKVHQSVEDAHVPFSEEQRHNYVNSTSYLALLSMYKSLLIEKRSEYSMKIDRLDNGLDKLISTKEQVAEMQQKILEMQPELEKTSKEVDDMMVRIAEDKKEAAATGEVEGEVAADSLAQET